jgi:ankyrin repeat protein
VSLKSSRQSGWADWWKLKKKSDQDFLWAAESGNLQNVRKYLNKDQMQDMVADVNAKGLHQWTALHFAADLGFLQIIHEVLSVPGVQVDALSAIQRTPLHLAAAKGHLDIGKLLIKQGADPNFKDFDESTPLHCASESG